MLQRAQTTGMFVGLDSDFRENQPDLRVRIDRARAADLGIPIEVIGRTLELMFGEREVSTFVDRGFEYQVIIQARPEDRSAPNDLRNVFVRTASGDLVPLSNVVTLAEIAGPQNLNRFDRLRSITIQGSPAPASRWGRRSPSSTGSRRRCCRRTRASPMAASRRTTSSRRTRSTSPSPSRW